MEASRGYMYEIPAGEASLVESASKEAQVTTKCWRWATPKVAQGNRLINIEKVKFNFPIGSCEMPGFSVYRSLELSLVRAWLLNGR
jgi:hypothetical protein